jgi:hypothetical protein
MSNLLSNQLHSEEFSRISDWLLSIKIPIEFANKYEQLLINCGYSNILSTISKVGLNEKDLLYIGINNPMHIRLILQASEGVFCTYAESLRIRLSLLNEYNSTTINEMNMPGSPAIMPNALNNGQYNFKIISRWRYNRSVIHVHSSSFQKLDKLLREELQKFKHFEPILLNLPSLPYPSSITSTSSFGYNSIENLNGSFRYTPASTSVHSSSSIGAVGRISKVNCDELVSISYCKAMETYLIKVIALLTDSPFIRIMLQFFELISSLPDERI